MPDVNDSYTQGIGNPRGCDNSGIIVSASKMTLVPLKYHSSSLSASAPFLDQSDLSIHLNSQSQVVQTRMAAVCCTLVAEVLPELDTVVL